MKNHCLEESEDLDEATTDSTSFQAQVSTKKKDSNMDYKYNKTPMEDLKILMKQSSSLFIDIRICQQMSTLIILDWILVIHMMMDCVTMCRVFTSSMYSKMRDPFIEWFAHIY